MLTPYILDLLTQGYYRNLDYYNSHRLPQVVEEPSNLPKQSQIMTAERLWKAIQPGLKSSQFANLNVNGQQGSGKSTVAREMAHQAEMDGYKIVYISAHEVEDAPEILQRESQGFDKVCVVFDDLSFILSTLTGRSSSTAKAYVGLIRHKIKARVFMITNVHVVSGIPPIFRNSTYWIFTKPTMQEFDVISRLCGKRMKEQLENLHTSIMTLHQAAEKSSKLPPFVYKKFRENFVWNKDGRLMLLVSNGIPQLYKATEEHCSDCEFIGSRVSQDVTKFMPQKKVPVDETKPEERKIEPKGFDSEDEPEELEEETWDEQKQAYIENLKSQFPSLTDEQIRAFMEREGKEK
jgi:hypothetical protein